MSWARLAQDLNIVLGLVLISRFLALGLEKLYRIFCLFLVVQFLTDFIAFLASIQRDVFPDYRVIWMISQAVIWVFTLWTVYALLEAILVSLPGILQFSRRLLNSVFVIAVLVGLLSARPEYSISGLSSDIDPVARALGVSIVLERVVCTIALLVLVSILGFVVWFPVELSRNLVIFTSGFIVYFAAKAALLLTHTFWSHDNLRLVSNLIMFISSACFAYWAVFINRAGATVPVKIGHAWHRREQERLIGQLEAVNAALVRAAARR